MSLNQQRSGFSLLEMMLALAILGGSLGMLSTLAMKGADAAREAEHLAQARLIAQSRLATLLASEQQPASLPATPTAAVDSESTTAFEYQLDVGTAPMQGILTIRITVRALSPNGGDPIATYSITRWMIDPMLGLGEEELGV
ncbi:type II secretion system protein [Allorhodopirellula solitaria]|uniref:Prepilin-type N-terminal cleavage/methylation domain-containing protein n=1 Tax=Allorhodopirellula solitaria TaxID=2527987 RepID=A0A5C5XSZ7_9BACT|nr:type II secretion system protein [Allorhodopirellula solitaria]TWT66376.1 hypothetical protein CA85_24700 [Allorhodopirellula solitaria]